jgi:hypothetical protein
MEEKMKRHYFVDLDHTLVLTTMSTMLPPGLREEGKRFATSKILFTHGYRETVLGRVTACRPYAEWLIDILRRTGDVHLLTTGTAGYVSKVMDAFPWMGKFETVTTREYLDGQFSPFGKGCFLIDDNPNIFSIGILAKMYYMGVITGSEYIFYDSLQNTNGVGERLQRHLLTVTPWNGASSDMELVDFTIRNEAFLKGESEHTGE